MYPSLGTETLTIYMEYHDLLTYIKGQKEHPMSFFPIVASCIDSQIMWFISLHDNDWWNFGMCLHNSQRCPFAVEKYLLHYCSNADMPDINPQIVWLILFFYWYLMFTSLHCYQDIKIFVILVDSWQKNRERENRCCGGRWGICWIYRLTWMWS